MEFTKLIEERRSIRAYQKTDISREEIEQMLYAAQQAPSWKNSETGRYYIAINKDTVKEVRDTCLPSFNYERTENVAAFIITAFKRGEAGFKPNGEQTDEHGNGWGCFDLGLQVENFILRARELGYDTLIMGLRNEEKLRKMMNIPDDEALMPVIALGRRATDPEKPERKAIKDIVKFF